jgi:hypothetical protein
VSKCAYCVAPGSVYAYPDSPRVRGRTIRDRTERFDGISGLFGRIWCCLGSFVPGPSVVRSRTVRDRSNGPGLYLNDPAMYGATWVVCAWTRVESDGPTKYTGRSASYPNGPRKVSDDP